MIVFLSCGVPEMETIPLAELKQSILQIMSPLNPSFFVTLIKVWSVENLALVWILLGHKITSLEQVENIVILKSYKIVQPNRKWSLI
jgi:hypothetical protein